MSSTCLARRACCIAIIDLLGSFSQQDSSWAALLDVAHCDRIPLDPFSYYVEHELRWCVGLDASGAGMRARNIVATIH